MIKKIKSFFKKFKTKQILKGVGLVGLVALAYSWNAGYILGGKQCSTTQVKSGDCRRGDMLYFENSYSAVKWCNFNRAVIVVPPGKSRNSTGKIICHYSGKTVTRRGQ